MQFDTANKIVSLCAKGMEQEVTDTEAAKNLFVQAWNEATTSFEKFIAAHYVARHQPSIEKKLQWDETALKYALQINDDSIQEYYPSLYLNIGKCYEELQDAGHAKINYEKALFYANNRLKDDYGHMIKSGIDAALKRLE